jgi:hypothetical protein
LPWLPHWGAANASVCVRPPRHGASPPTSGLPQERALQHNRTGIRICPVPDVSMVRASEKMALNCRYATCRSVFCIPCREVSGRGGQINRPPSAVVAGQQLIQPAAAHPSSGPAIGHVASAALLAVGTLTRARHIKVGSQLYVAQFDCEAGCAGWPVPDVLRDPAAILLGRAASGQQRLRREQHELVPSDREYRGRPSVSLPRRW